MTFIDGLTAREDRYVVLAAKLEFGDATAEEALEAANALSYTAGDRLRLERRVDALELGLAFFMRVMKIFADLDSRDDLLWTFTDGDFPQFGVDCSSFFERGTADAEPLTPENLHLLEQAIRDVQQTYHAGNVLAECDWALPLFCARARGRRPLPRVIVPEDLQPLFDAAGPER